MSTEDTILIQKFKAGELQAFDALVLKYQKFVFNLIYRFTGGSNEAEDLAQEVFARLYRALPGFKAQSTLLTYIYRITLNLCLRARSARKDLSLEENLTGHKEGTETSYLKFEIQEVVRKALMALVPEQRAVVVLARYQDLSYNQIAGILKISLPAVKSRLHKALLRLKGLLDPYVKEGEIYDLP
jgi:RNA polymerase sigma-70 factor, ECF subfamily